MKKLTDKEFYACLQIIRDMVGKPHKDYEVQLILADLYFTISQGNLWEFPKMLWRGWKIKKVVKLHKKCCDLED